MPEFELAVQVGEIATVRDGAGRPGVPAAEVVRLRRAAGGTAALQERIRLVSTTSGAELLGVSRDRLLRLTRAGRVRPARWYVNRYRAVVWLYLVEELREFAGGNPALLAGRLPVELRASAEAGEDLRPRGWRSRQVVRLVREAPGPWEEAAIWAALLGPEVTAVAVPDPYERTHLRTIHPELPHGRPGPLADASLVGRLTTADAPDEIETALLALSAALARARHVTPAPRPLPIRALPGASPRAAGETVVPAAGGASPLAGPVSVGGPGREPAFGADGWSGPRVGPHRSAAVPRPRMRPAAPLLPLPQGVPVPEEEAAELRLVAGGVRAAPGAGCAGRAPAGPPPGEGRATRAPAGAGAPSGRALRSLRRLLRKGRQLSAG